MEVSKVEIIKMESKIRSGSYLETPVSRWLAALVVPKVWSYWTKRVTTTIIIKLTHRNLLFQRILEAACFP